MTRGRKPIVRRFASNDDPRQAPLAIPAPPESLRGEALAEWHRITVLLYDLGIVAELDAAALAVYCKNWARWLAAEAELDRQGVVVKSPNGYPIQNPYLAVANGAAKQMQTLLAEFGLSAAARQRLLGSAPQAPGDEIENYLREPIKIRNRWAEPPAESSPA